MQLERFLRLRRIAAQESNGNLVLPCFYKGARPEPGIDGVGRG